MTGLLCWQSRAVNFVWNYCNDRQKDAFRFHRRWHTGFDLNKLTTGSSRDTLGVFVMSIEDGGPAAKAGIEEGTRIASINGVDVRGRASTDEDDYVLRTSNVRRLERELAKVKPGEDVDLRVYFGGQHRNVKVKAGRWSDTPRRNRSGCWGPTISP